MEKSLIRISNKQSKYLAQNTLIRFRVLVTKNFIDHYPIIIISSKAIFRND